MKSSTVGVHLLIFNHSKSLWWISYRLSPVPQPSHLPPPWQNNFQPPSPSRKNPRKPKSLSAYIFLDSEQKLGKSKDSAIPRCFFLPLNWYERTNIAPKFLRTRFVKRTYTRQVGSASSANLDTLNSKQFYGRAHKSWWQPFSST